MLCPNESNDSKYHCAISKSDNEAATSCTWPKGNTSSTSHDNCIYSKSRYKFAAIGHQYKYIYLAKKIPRIILYRTHFQTSPNLFLWLFFYRFLYFCNWDADTSNHKSNVVALLPNLVLDFLTNAQGYSRLWGIWLISTIEKILLLKMETPF